MTEMTLAEAMAEVKTDLRNDDQCYEDTVAFILNAVASGDLIPRTDAELAVALAYQRARDECFTRAQAREAAIQGSSLEDASYHLEVKTSLQKAGTAILALAPAEPLAEVERMRRQIEAVCRAHMVGAERSVALEDRAEAAEAEVARLRALMRRVVEDPVWRTNDNTLWPDLCAALTPQKDATP